MREIALYRPQLVAAESWNNAHRLLDNRFSVRLRNPLTTILVRNDRDSVRVQARPNDVERGQQGGWYYSTAETVLFAPNPDDVPHHQARFMMQLRDWTVVNGLSREWGRPRIGEPSSLADRQQAQALDKLVGPGVFENTAEGALTLITVGLDTMHPLADSVDQFGRTAMERTEERGKALEILNRAEQWFQLGRARNSVDQVNMTNERLQFQTEWGKVTLHAQANSNPGDQVTVEIERRDDYSYEFDSEGNAYQTVPIDRYVVKRNQGTIQLIEGRHVYNGTVLEEYVDDLKPDFASLAGSLGSQYVLDRIKALEPDQMISPNKE